MQVINWCHSGKDDGQGTQKDGAGDEVVVDDEDIVVDGVGTDKEVVLNDDEDLVIETDEGADEVVLDDNDIIVEDGSGLDHSASIDCCDDTYSDMHDTDYI